MAPPSQPIAGGNVGDRRGEQDKSAREHDQVQHRIAPGENDCRVRADGAGVRNIDLRKEHQRMAASAAQVPTIA